MNAELIRHALAEAMAEAHLIWTSHHDYMAGMALKRVSLPTGASRELPLTEETQALRYALVRLHVCAQNGNFENYPESVFEDVQTVLASYETQRLELEESRKTIAHIHQDRADLRQENAALTAALQRRIAERER